MTETPDRYVKLGSSFTTMQAHVSPDGRYLIVPVVSRSATITKWRVYDAVDGDLLPGEWDTQFDVRDFLTKEGPPERATFQATPRKD